MYKIQKPLHRSKLKILQKLDNMLTYYFHEFTKIFTILCDKVLSAKYESENVQKNADLVDLGKCWKMGLLSLS